MKKKVLSILMACALCTGLVPTAVSASESDYEGQTLSVFLYAEYIPDSVFEDFEDEYGVTVNVSTYTTDEELLAKMQGSADGTYDVINPGDYMVEYMAQNGMLAELNKDQLTNYSNIGEQYLGQDYDPDNTYSVPFCPGEYVIAYNSEVYPDGFTSLSDLLDPSLKNSVTVVDDPRVIIGLVSMGLGYSLNETDPDKLAEIKDALLAFKDNVYALKDNGNLEALVSGEVTLAYTYNGSSSGAEMETDGVVKVVYPEEGSYKWLDNLAIPATSEKQELATEFINYVLRADVDAKIHTEIPTSSPNTAGQELMSDEFKNSSLIIDETSWNNSERCLTLDDDTQAIYDEMFAEFAQ